MRRTTVHLIAAARPNFMKIAPIWHAFRATDDFTPVLVHTGQHYDAVMSDAIFADLRLPSPDHNLEVGSGSHAEQTGRVMMAYEKLALAGRPDYILVVGDVNSTLACALVGAKLVIPVIHLEAGLRSRDRTMPEEINRLATDAVSDVLWTPSPDADENLRNEGVPAERISFVGNIMIDSYEMIRPTIRAAGTPEQLGLVPGSYGVVTLHRPSNVDEPDRLAEIVEVLVELNRTLPLVFPAHPRTQRRLEETRLGAVLEGAGVRLGPPLPYAAFMSLIEGSAAAITDSGGIQEETTYLGIPCLTLRENTERPITVTQGTNRLVRPATLCAAARDALAARARERPTPPALWDGHTAERCVVDLRRRVAARAEAA